MTTSDEAIDKWPRFAGVIYGDEPRVFSWIDAIKARMEEARKEYGDASFGLPLPRLLAEVSQELLDVGGWAYIADEKPMTNEQRDRLRQVARHACLLWMEIDELDRELDKG